MRPLLIISLCLFTLSGYSQEKNSLLWEISGNGLEKSSYLYGTMHVSKKIAFRLDDVFYEALDQSEMVALESDPGLWLENSDAMGNGAFGYGGYVTKGFYANAFKVENPKKELLGAYLAYEDRIVNNILYRTNEHSQNFEEETYLDMFIYQAGKKFDKAIVALEDMEESSALVGRASMNAMKQRPDEWLQKKIQQSDPMFLLQDAYRERNIALLDSIDRAMYTDHYMKNMLHIRNVNMAERLDSVMRKGKVFAGIGAAHLPGDDGVIDLLREKGYTVAPLVSKSSARGKELKQQFEEKKRENDYASYGPEDGFFKIDLPTKLYPVSDLGKTTYVSPDLANGSFVVVNRIPTHSFLKQDAVYTLEDIDKLLFENIPGKILEKTYIENDGLKGLDIKNQLKNGDRQRYQIFKTPLEIVIFKMGGEGDYVTQHSDRIFNSLVFKRPTDEKMILFSDFRDFEVEMPSLNSFTNQSRNGDRWIEGYDEKRESYYFLRKSVLNDFSFIEVDTFELKQIQKRFYQDLELKPRYRDVDGKRLISSAIFDTDSGKRLHLMTTFRGGEYYLLGILTEYGKEADEFFESFQLKPAKYEVPYETVVDTALYFSTKSTVKPPKFVESSNSYYSGAPKTKSYDPFHKKTVYRNKNDEAITVELNKSHDFLMFGHLDSAWALRKKMYAYKQFKIIGDSTETTPEGNHEMQLTLIDTASTRGILIKNVIKDGLLYELKAVVDTIERPSRFITEFFGNFKPKDTAIGRNIFEDKVPDFFAALRKNDSIVLDGHRYLKFDKTHVDSLQHYISEHEFSPAIRQIQSYMILQLGQLKDVDATEFYRDFYAESYNNSTAQAMVLQAISQKSDEASAELLLELMAADLPLLSNTFHISYIFAPYRENLSVAKKLFPELLQYSTISEYKAPIFSLLAKLVAEDGLKSKVYKKHKSQILNDAKIQLKRQLGRDVAPNAQDFYSPRTPTQDKGVLEDYVTLLYAFNGEKRVQQFLGKVALIEDPDIRTTYIALLAKNNRPIPQKKLTALASDLNSRQLLFDKLQKVGKPELFPEKFKTQKDLAEALLFPSRNYSATRDSIAFLGKKALAYKDKQLTGYYFKKRNNEDYDKNFNMHLLVFEDDKGPRTEAFYENGGMRIEDTDTDEDVIEFVTETFLLKDRQRADVYRPNGYGGGYGHYGY
ncbi:TraB/GumN family protein [Pricia sp.]|uniref:TraB/GumN family protein n=1 Tax=Pricia sp. TaxID=2268138 RepID=UPI003592F702